MLYHRHSVAMLCGALVLCAGLTSNSVYANEANKSDFARFNVRPFFAFGLGLKDHTVGQAVNTTTNEVTSVKLSAGGGYGGGLGLRFGVTPKFAIDTVFGTQVTTESPEVSDASAEFDRQYLLVTALAQKPVRGNYRFYGGFGVGSYRGGKMDVSGFSDVEVDYEDALGYHVLIGWESIPVNRFYGGLAIKFYSVDYDAEKMMFAGIPVADISVDGKSISSLDGSGVDMSLYFAF